MEARVGDHPDATNFLEQLLSSPDLFAKRDYSPQDYFRSNDLFT